MSARTRTSNTLPISSAAGRAGAGAILLVGSSRLNARQEGVVSEGLVDPQSVRMSAGDEAPIQESAR